MYAPNRVYRILAVALVLVLTLSASGWSTAGAGVSAGESLTETLASVPAVGSMELSRGWALISANNVTDNGDTVSQVGYDVSSWYPITIPSTVLAGLVANGVYSNLYYGMNLKSVPDLTHQNWWYRGEFTAPANPGGQYWLRFKRIAYKAEIWLNGTLLDANAEGTLVVHEYNVTNLINAGGANAIAVKVTPPVGTTNLSYWYVDWNPAPPDMSAGISDKVLLDMSGPVELRDPYVKTVLPLPATDSADLTVYVDAENGTASPVDGVLQAVITKAGYPTITVKQPVTLAANERREITFDPTTFTDLHLTNPALWWPFTMGSPELYDLKVSFQIGMQPSASQSIKFGIRQVTQYHTPPINGTSYFQGFQVNGKNFLVRGSAYMWDMLMRWDTPTNEAHMKYAKDMGLNTIRFEGILGNEEIYDIADREGIMLMPGFVCCSRWERWSRWTAAEANVANASLESQMRLMRAHASALVWLYGSDGSPTDRSPYYVLSHYKAIAEKLHWQNATVNSAATDGIKMNGPYVWEPPLYWYQDTEYGGAWGICAEEGGETPPPIESLKKFIPPDQLWPMTFGSSSAYSYHAGTLGSEFDNITVYNTGLNNRYGAPSSLSEYSDKAQLQSYEAARGQFEAFAANAYDPATGTGTATGTIFWMMNNAWPSIHWNLYDYYMKPAGSYFGTKKANEPVHVLWDYNTNKVKVFNSTLSSYTGMQVSAAVYNIPDFTQQYTRQMMLDVPADVSTEAFTIPAISGLSTTYFIRLQLKDSSGNLVSNNLYWYSTQLDVLDYPNSDWYITPVTSYADLTGLNALPTNTSVTASAFTKDSGSQEIVTIRVDNTSTTNIAFFVRVEVTKGQGGEEVLPVTYSDNYITLWPGESATINAQYARADLGGQPPFIRVKGYNVAEFTNTVSYFAGFFPPVDNWPVLNTAKAGSAIPVMFSLGGDKGLDIFATGYPKSQVIPCDSTMLVDGVDPTVTPGGSDLSYYPKLDLYTYVWKTDKAWAGTCRQLVVKLTDGTYHHANFKFK
jgi:exo-1,4-beta-D-glucosaminidase